MADITPIVATAYTPESTTSTSSVFSSLESGVLADGVEYLVFARGGVGGNDTDAKPIGLAALGDTGGSPGDGTQFASVRREGRGLSNHWDSGQFQAFAILTGDGTSRLYTYFRNQLSSDEAFLGAQVLIAIPLDQLTPDEDYFFDQQVGVSDADQVDNIDDTPQAIGGTITFDLPGPTQDWIALGAVNANYSGGSASDAHQAALFVDDAQVGPTWHKEWEDSQDLSHFPFAYLLEDIAAGEHDFELRVSNRQSNAVVGGRRHRMILLRKDAFAQVIEVIDTTGVGTPFSNGSYDESASFMDQAISVGQANRHVLGIAIVSGGNSTTQTTLMELRNETDDVSDSVDAGEYENDSGFDSGRDQVPTMLLYCQQHTSTDPKTISVRYRVDGGTGILGRNPDNSGGIRSNLLLIELATAGTVIQPDPVLFDLVVPNPSVDLGSLAIAPSPALLSLLAPNPSVGLGALAVAPDPVELAFAVPAPAIAQGALILAPDPVLLSLVAASPALDLGQLTIAPSPAILGLAVPEPSVVLQVEVEIAPTPVVLELVVPDVDVALGLVVSPDPVQLILSALGAFRPQPVAVTRGRSRVYAHAGRNRDLSRRGRERRYTTPGGSS